ncbi:hypothetical protein N6H14_26850 [Paenibacillus sp. CC-CFT747]|nr:hypothetical protein N6H14_26850 [Paenibacillus sp. CC-CFT747]
MIILFSRVKNLFQDKCPVCRGKLQAVSEAACCTKLCPQGHYKEENYGTLGVTIVYDSCK